MRGGGGGGGLNRFYGAVLYSRVRPTLEKVYRNSLLGVRLRLPLSMLLELFV